MQVHFYGLLYGEQLKNSIEAENTASYAIQKFNKNLVEALKKNYEVKVVSPVFTYKHIMSKEQNGDAEYEYIKYHGKLGRIRLVFLSFLKALKDNKKIIIADALNISMVYGMMKANRYTDNKVILVVTDIPEDILSGQNTIYARMFLYNLERADGFIFLTKQTNEDYNKKGKPFTLIEGIAKAEEVVPYQIDKKVCIYAGGLVDKYYIRKLVDAFEIIAKEDEVLYIFGDGECKNYVEKRAEKSKNIKYMGTMSNEEILKFEASAELLINPRPDIGEYTKYSFPSKLIEYMNSGTPALVNKLCGVPEEYYDKLYLFSGYEDDSYKESLRTVLDVPKEEKIRLGQEAKVFIQNRNGMNVVAEKLKDLINKLV